MPYEITYRNITTNSNPVTTRSEVPTIDIHPVLDGNYYSVSVVAINALGVRSPPVILGPYQVIGKLLPPANIVNFTATRVKYSINLLWNANTDIDLLGYEIRKGDTWNTGTTIESGSTATSFTDNAPGIGVVTYWIVAIDTTGNISTPVSATAAAVAMNAPSLSYVINGTDYILSWAEPTSSHAIDHYEIRYGSTWESSEATAKTTKATVYQNPVLWGGVRKFFVAGIDIAGNTGTVSNIDIEILIPKLTEISTQVVDNNVLFNWTDSKTTLPVDYYELRKGTSYGSASIVGTKSGLFTILFETEGGTYTYWITGIDSAGNYGYSKSIITTVNQPPDYILSNDFNSSFSGELVDAAVSSNTLTMPHNINETWQSHFTVLRVISMAVSAGGSGYAVGDTFRLNTGTYTEHAEGTVTTVSGGTATGVLVTNLGYYTVTPSSPGATVTLTGTGTGLTITPTLNGASGWASPDEQVTDGFTYYSQPTEHTGYYEETIDYGAIMPSNKITMLLDTVGTIGTPSILPTLSISSTGDVVLNKYDLSQASWTKTNCTISAGAVNDPKGDSATNITVNRTGTTDHLIKQTCTVASTINKTFKFDVWLKLGTMTGTVQLRIKDGADVELTSVSVSPNANYWQRFSITGTFGGSSAANVIFCVDPNDNTGVDGDTFFVWGAQGGEWTDYTDVYTIYATNFRYLKYTIQANTATAGTDLLNIRNINIKLDSKILNDAGGMLAIASADSNKITNPEDFTHADWTKNSFTISSQTVTNPSGGTTTSRAIEAAAADLHYAVQSTTNISSAVTSNMSVLAKNYSGSRYLHLTMADNGATSNYCSATFDIIAGTVTHSYNGGNGTGATASIEDYGNGWYRCALIGKPNTSGTESKYTYGISNVSNSDALPSYTGDGTSGFYLWGAQAEAGSTIYSYGKGTGVNFSTNFTDISSISVSPMGSTALYSVVNFLDYPSPEGFKVLLFDSAGARIAGNVSWTAKGF